MLPVPWGCPTVVLDVTVPLSNNPYSGRTWLSTNQKGCGRRDAPGAKGRMCRKERVGLGRSRDRESQPTEDVNIVYGALSFLDVNIVYSLLGGLLSINQCCSNLWGA